MPKTSTSAKTPTLKESATEVQIRRAPKYLPFMITGAAAGVILAVILNTLIPDEQRTGQPILGYLIVFLGALGFALGIVSALVFDRVFRARAQTLEATKLEG